MTENTDDACYYCSDGGDVLCCDSCPRVYHLECANLSKMPRSKCWFCPECKAGRSYVGSASEIYKSVAKLNEKTVHVDVIDGFEFRSYLPPKY